MKLGKNGSGCKTMLTLWLTYGKAEILCIVTYYNVTYYNVL